MWKILDTGVGAAKRNMEIDRSLLEKMDPDDAPILHFYDWEKDAATYGHFLNPGKLIDLKAAEKFQLSLARRPTGGGMVFHVTDLAFSVLIPAHYPHFSLNTLDNYHFINSRVKSGIQTFFENEPALLPKDPLPLDENCPHFCMAKPTVYDVVLDGRKIAGAAQRRKQQGYLHQGTIAIALPKEDFLNAILLPGTQVKEAMLAHTFSILGEGWTENDLVEVREVLKRELQKELTQ